MEWQPEALKVTMIPDREYIETYGEGRVSFLDKGQYEGIILFSELDGTFIDIYVYRNAPIYVSKLYSPDDINDADNIKYLMIENGSSTKSLKAVSVIGYDPGDEIDGGILNPSVCTGSGTDSIDPSYCIANKKKPDDEPEEPYTPPAEEGDGGGGNPASQPKQDPLRCTVDLSVDWTIGIVSGSGIYPRGRLVTCYAIPRTTEVFVKWTGDLDGYTATVTIPSITKDITATAIFQLGNEKRPCRDNRTGKSNPFYTMKLAPTKSGNIYNALFSEKAFKGKSTRPKPHNGIDFAAEVGTPVNFPF